MSDGKVLRERDASLQRVNPSQLNAVVRVLLALSGGSLIVKVTPWAAKQRSAGDGRLAMIPLVSGHGAVW